MANKLTIFNNETARLTDVKLNKFSDGGYYLRLTYRSKDEDGNIHEEVLDGVPLPLYNYPKMLENTEDITTLFHPVTKTDVGYGKVELPSYATVVDCIVEYATKEMTIDEIEEKLGYKVKIVNGTGDGKKE